MLNEFITESGIHVPAITARQMAEVDRIAMEETGPNLFQMMENAGRNLALTAIKLLGNGYRNLKVVILCGTGGNGGGGICAGRHLANRNIEVKICITASARLKPVTAFQRKVFLNTGGKEIGLEQLSKEKADLIIDAVIGYNLNSAPRGNALEMIEWANSNETKILSLDVPSGVDATTGKTPGNYMKANTILTLALPKTGLLPEFTGELLLADIGIPAKVYERAEIKYQNPFGDKFIVKLISGK